MTSAPSAAMRRCSVGAAITVAPPGDRLGERELTDVVHQRGVLEVEQLGVAHAELPPDGDRELADPRECPVSV